MVLGIHDHNSKPYLSIPDDDDLASALLADLKSRDGDLMLVLEAHRPSGLRNSADLRHRSDHWVHVPEAGGSPSLGVVEDKLAGRVLRSITYHVALAWLRLHWGHQARDQASDATSRAIIDLKTAGTNLQGWLDVAEASTQTESTNCPLEEAFTRQYANALAEAQILAEALSFESTQLNIRETRKAIELSKQSLREAHAVGRLTQLAFLFLPLTFITGIFGMNIKPFNEGAPMWKFYVTTFAILIPFWVLGITTSWEEVEQKYRSLHGRSLQREDTNDLGIKEMRRLLELPVVTLIYFSGRAVSFVLFCCLHPKKGWQLFREYATWIGVVRDNPRGWTLPWPWHRWRRRMYWNQRPSRRRRDRRNDLDLGYS